MNKRKQDDQILLLINLVQSLKRYRVAILCSRPASGKSQIAKAAANQLQGRYINLAIDLLPQIANSDFFPTLGAYGPENLTDWILNEARKLDVTFLFIDQMEPLLATFGRAKAAQFFQMAGQIEPRTAVVLVTCLTKQVEQGAFPKERLILM